MRTISKGIEIFTERLKLRAASASDIELVWSASRRAGFNDWMVWDPPESRNELESVALRNEVDWDSGKSYNFTFELLNTFEGIGRITIRQEVGLDIWNIGYWVHPDYWGLGYATEAARAIIEFGKSEISAVKITVTHAKDNVASQRVIEKLGFIRTGENLCGFKKGSKSVPEYEYVLKFAAS